MKDKVLTIITVVLIGVLLVVLQSCKNDDTPLAEEDVFTRKISQTWKVRKVTATNVDVTGAFKSMAITFRTDHSYSVVNAVSPIWPSVGTFENVPVTDGVFNIRRDDGVVINVTFLTDASVILELLYTQTSGRMNEVSGQYKFELTR